MRIGERAPPVLLNERMLLPQNNHINIDIFIIRHTHLRRAIQLVVVLYIIHNMQYVLYDIIM